MAIQFPQIDIASQFSGGRDGWDSPAGDIVGADFFPAALDMVAAPGDYASSGEVLSLSAGRKVEAGNGGMASTGEQATMSTTPAPVFSGMAASPGLYAMAGADACLAGDNILVDETGEAILDGYGDWILTEGCGRVVLPLQAWSCGLSGTDATCYQHRTLAAGAGSVIVAGQATGAHRVVSAGGGANVTVWLQSGLIGGRIVSAGPGVAVLAGSACAPVSARSIASTLGAHNIAGSSAVVAKQIHLPASAGAHAIAGASASLDKVLVVARALAADSGAYSGSFHPAGLTGARIGQLSPGALSVTGAMSSGGMVRVMGSSPAVLALSGAGSGLLRQSLIKSDPWATVASWSNAGLARSLTIQPDPSTLAISGADASFAKIRLVSMPAYPGGMAWDGAESILARTNLPMAADHGAIYGSGAEASLATSLIIEPGPGDYQQVFTDSVMEHGWGVFFPVIDFAHIATPASFMRSSSLHQFDHMATKTEFTPPEYGTEYSAEIRQTTFSLA